MLYHSKGGQVTAVRSREKAVARYYASPNHCHHCREIIPVSEKEKVPDVRRKKFCNHSCAAIYNNARHPKKEKIIQPPKIRPSFDLVTKGELFTKRAGWQSARTAIRLHASRIYVESRSPRICAVCGYDLHVQICHRIPVSKFPPTATLSEINDIQNLVALCPNHHWELDHGHLSL